MFYSFSIIFLLAAIISVVNHKWLKLPSTIGSLILALMSTLLVISTQFYSPSFYEQTCNIVQDSNFSDLLLNIMLSFLLFAGSIHIDIRKLLKEKTPILTFASFGILINTVLFGGLFYFGSQLLSLDLPLMVCMLLGSIISPTDPIAVLAILKTAGISESLELRIEGESLFNDGFGVVVFTVILAIVENNVHGPILNEIGLIFLHEVLGGLLFGLVLGYIAKHLLLAVVQDTKLTIMITIAIVMGGYAIAHTIGVSGLLSMVMLGLYLGHFINSEHYPKILKSKINELWEVLDYSLNVILFVLIGVSMHVVEIDIMVLVGALLSIIVMLFSRYISVVLSSFVIDIKSIYQQKTSLILTWGALRGGISLALVMSLAESSFKSTLLTIVFIIVVFSILVQGLTLGKVVKNLSK